MTVPVLWLWDGVIRPRNRSAPKEIASTCGSLLRSLYGGISSRRRWGWSGLRGGSVGQFNIRADRESLDGLVGEKGVDEILGSSDESGVVVHLG